jgi:cold shock CspA family protein/ribosome-associated translation inhibitor RaiA
MQIPVDITFKELEPTDALRNRIREWVDKLERVYDRITRCEVVVETPHRHHRQGREFHIRVRLTVPGGKELVASHDPGPDGSHEDVNVALRDTFEAIRRQLQDHVRTRVNRKSEERAEPSRGRVTFVDVESEWGWIEPDDGRRIYFHRNSVLGGMDQLHVGDEVRFAEEEGEKGPQASTVEAIGANGHHAMPAAG